MPVSSRWRSSATSSIALFLADRRRGSIRWHHESSGRRLNCEAENRMRESMSMLICARPDDWRWVPPSLGLAPQADRRPDEAAAGDGARRRSFRSPITRRCSSPATRAIFSRGEPERDLGAGGAGRGGDRGGVRRQRRNRRQRRFSSRWWRAATVSISMFIGGRRPESAAEPPDNSALLVRGDDTIRSRQGPRRQEDLRRPDQQRRTTSICWNGCSKKGVDPQQDRNSWKFHFRRWPMRCFKSASMRSGTSSRS